MDIEFQHAPGNTVAKVVLQPGEICTADAGAMMAMSGHTQITTTTHKKGSGGILKGIKRMLAGESFFVNHFEAAGKPSEIYFGAGLAGDMMEYQLDNESLIVQGSSFLVCEHQVEVDMGWQGFKSLFSGESVFWVNLKGSGKVIVNSFGAIYPVEVDGEFIVDGGHIVAFNETLDFTITKAGSSWLNSFLGGEGLVCKFQGKGTVWCQSHNPSAFGHSLTSDLKPRKR